MVVGGEGVGGVTDGKTAPCRDSDRQGAGLTLLNLQHTSW